MCVIAGYSGNRRAAPLLIEMMKKIEYVDGGYATGIATVHEGKIYYAKSIGDVEMLLRTTDAMDLPGTVGIIHSRPNGEFFTVTHPYFDADMSIAMVENGGTGATGCQALYDEFNRVMDDLLDQGIVSPASRDLNAARVADVKDLICSVSHTVKQDGFLCVCEVLPQILADIQITNTHKPRNLAALSYRIAFLSCSLRPSEKKRSSSDSAYATG